MGIPKAQLEAWSGKGADSASADAYARITRAFETHWPGPARPKIYLQGSYANATNTRGDSDVDIVVEYGQTFGHNTSRLQPDHLMRWRATYPSDATYRWEHVQRDALVTLSAAFPGAVTPGNKALKVKLGSGRMTADVVPAILHREYETFHQSPGTAYEGIEFRDSNGNTIINYPLIHIAHGAAKNHATRTSGQYKAVVRVFKNFRTYLVETGLLAEGIAPSYFVECLVYNAPDSLFAGTLDEVVLAILRHWWNSPVNGYVTQNHRSLLIGAGNTQWPESNAVSFIAAAVRGWDNYR